MHTNCIVDKHLLELMRFKEQLQRLFLELFSAPSHLRFQVRLTPQRLMSQRTSLKNSRVNGVMLL